MIRVLFVCHGNICRSPMAEMIFADLVHRRTTKNEYFVSSAATSDEEIFRGVGNPVYPPAKAELIAHGIPLIDHRAIRLTKADYEKYDLLIGMDSRNIRNMQYICGGDPDNKIRKLMDYVHGGDVSDPWYSDRFDIAFRDIEKGCIALLEALEKA